MLGKRKDDRVEVDLPIACKLEGRQKMCSGKIQDLSISGLRLDLALPFSGIRSKILDFVLELPAPFNSIRGSGEIQWKRWNAASKRTECGLKLEPMTLQHLSDLEAIVSEVGEAGFLQEKNSQG